MMVNAAEVVEAMVVVVEDEDEMVGAEVLAVVAVVETKATLRVFCGTYYLDTTYSRSTSHH